jgi:hypothetical protein
MSNIVQFPSGRYLPPTPTVDALIGELATVEIELARARLAQIQLETRQATVLWTWYCLKRALLWGFAGTSRAQAQYDTGQSTALSCRR